MRVKKKVELKSIICNKIIHIVKNSENNIQNKPSYINDEDKNKVILMFNDQFYNLINNQNLS